MIGLKYPDLDTGVSGLVGYRLGDLDQPAWVAKQRVPDDLLYAVRNQPGPHKFILHHVFLFDVFSEVDGVEIVSVHRDAKLSACVVQIRSADGQLLSEFAHDGQLDSLYWEPMNEVLYCAGLNSDGDWKRRGESEQYVGRYPLVVFAVRPEFGATGLVVQHPGIRGSIQPIWYQCLLPASLYSLVAEEKGDLFMRINRPGLPADLRAGNIEIQVGGGSGPEHQIFVVDQTGSILHRRPTESWEEETGLASTELYFGQLPPRSVKREYEQ